MEYSKNIQTVLNILRDEANGDVASALKKMTADYSMTWMYKGKESLFPSTGVSPEIEMKEVYPIKGRVYDIRNLSEGTDVVMVELIESYPDPETGKTYRTPQVLVLEMQDGKIRKGRHYCDPTISYLDLSETHVDEALKGTLSKLKIP